MQFRLKQIKDNVLSSFWYIPFGMTILIIALAMSMLYMDYNSYFYPLKKYLHTIVGADNARTTLSIIATAVITITSVTFSMTVLTLSIASNQLGPRLLPNFMRQKTTQLVLGLFVGTFIISAERLLPSR